VGRQLQSALTKEVELVKHGELVAELVKLHQHDRCRESHRAVF
jgi:antitoxin (DNA-binding transcriptional repressor) of toxin-antitoxin stability system